LKMSKLTDDCNSEDVTSPGPALRDGPGVVRMLTFLSCIGGFLFGYDTGIISGALLLLTDKFDLNEWEQEMVVSLTVVGALIAAAAGGALIDRFGRRRTILASSLLFGAGALMMAATPNLAGLYAGRFLIGLGVGSGSMAVPVYMSEVADTEVRGTLLTCINVAITMGQFVACLVAGAFSYVSDGWRYMLGLALLPAVVQFIGMLYMPESPRWLVEQGRGAEALSALRQLRGRGGEADNECTRIMDAREMEPGGGSSARAAGGGMGYRIFLTNGPSRRALILGCALQAAQQFGGINTIM
jgi:SP family myo-inositol transporter-like MFS transporter 13